MYTALYLKTTQSALKYITLLCLNFENLEQLSRKY